MQAMSLRSLSVVAIFWTVGVAVLATKIGGFPAVLIVAVFILPLVFSSIDAAWQASVLTPSLSHSGKSPTIRRPEPAAESIPEQTADTEPETAIPQPVIPEPAPPPTLDLEPALPAGDTIQL